MTKEFDRIIQKGIKEKNPSIFSSEIKHLTEKYGVCEKTIYNRFFSVYNKKPKELILDEIFPSKEELTSIILNSSSSTEVQKQLNLSNRLFVGIYDKYFGVSTFKKAKETILATKLTTLFKPNIPDNRSIIYSQILGDGSYDKKRHALIITHGEKQAEYLKWKVSLINAGYPQTKSVVTKRIHKQGHTYFSYYTNLGNIDIPAEEYECVKNLTNLGWLLWFLDDGSYCQNISISCKRDEKIKIEAIHELSTYGIKARYDETKLIMCGGSEDIKFFINFIKPFYNKIPICMKYKTEDIVEKYNINLL